MTRRTLANSRHRGRPAALTPDVVERIIHVVEQGNHITTACAVAGVARSTVYGWLRRAGSASIPGDAQDIGALDLACIEFERRLAEAKARAEMRAVDIVVRAMTGGQLVSERPATGPAGAPIRDADGSVLFQRTYSRPDGRLALAFLARAFPERWGPSAPPTPLDDCVRNPMEVRYEPSPEQIKRLRDHLNRAIAQTDLQRPSGVRANLATG